MGGGDMGKKEDRSAAQQPEQHAMMRVLATFQRPDRTGFEDAWIGMEPTFQTAKSIKKWEKMSARKKGEDAYFETSYMLDIEQKMARVIVKEYRASRKKGKPYCPFASVKRNPDTDPWDVARQNLRFHWDDEDLPYFEARFGMDPETWEYSLKPVPVAWLYEEDFVKFLEHFIWGVPKSNGLSTSIAHGGGQLSISAKTLMGGSLLADDIAYRVSHPELATFIMDAPSADTRSFRATRERFSAFRDVLRHYWAGGFHPQAIGALTAENAILDRGWGPNQAPPAGLMNPQTGPVGNAQDIFQTNFAFGRAVRWQAQNIQPGYWQGSAPDAQGYRPDQVMRYSETNLNRLQIAGEHHVKNSHTLDAKRVPEFDAPLEIGMLYDEACYEDRAQMSRTTARDFVEAALLDIHHLRYLSTHPGVKVADSLLQDQLLVDAEETLARHGGEQRLAELRQEARKTNEEDSEGRVCSDFIEPETLFWETWTVLPASEKAAIAREAISGFIERVEAAAETDPRPSAKAADPMEWHRHRVHPVLWEALEGAELSTHDPVRRELDQWTARRDEYMARRPIYSQAGNEPPWEVE
jgi:hypothetical protein